MGEKLFRVLHRTWGNLHEAALLMAVFALLSQLLALVRDRLLASHFGAGETLDIYYAAFRIPDLIFVSVASLAAVTVLVPFLFQKLEEDPTRQAARRFMDDVFTTFLGVLLVTIILVAIFVPYFAHLVVPGFSDADQAEFILLTRILLLSPLLFGLSNLLGTITQSFGRFFVFAAGPVLYNIAIISGIVMFEPVWGIRGIAFGVILGACAHMLIQVPVVLREGLLPRLTFRPRLSEIRRVVGTSLPRTLALASAHLAATVLVALASTMESGSIAVFTLALNLQSIPLAIVGVSYSVAAFPALAKLFTKGDHDEFLKEITTAARHIIFWSIPATVLFIVLRAQVVRTAFGSGHFDWTATRLVAAALALFAVSVVAQSLMLLLVRGYYAMGNTRTPLFVNVLSSSVTVVLGLLLSWLFGHTPMFRYFIESILRVDDIPGTVILMLPLAYTLGMLLNMVLLFASFERHFPSFLSLIKKSFLHSFAASVCMGFVAYHALGVFDNVLPTERLWGIFLQGALSGLAGIAVHIFLLRLLENTELNEITRSVRHKFWKEKPIAPEVETI